MKREIVILGAFALAACTAKPDVVCTDQNVCFAVDPEGKTLTLDEKTIQKMFSGQMSKANAGDGVNALLRYGARIEDVEACRQAFIKTNGGNEFKPREPVIIPKTVVCGMTAKVGIEPQKPADGLSFLDWVKIISSTCCVSALLGGLGFLKMTSAVASEATEPARRPTTTSSNGTYDGWIETETPINLPPGVSHGTGLFPASWHGRSEIEIGSLGAGLRRGGATQEQVKQMVNDARTAADQLRTVNGASYIEAAIAANEDGKPIGIVLDATNLTPMGREILQNHTDNIINNANDDWTVDKPPGSLK